MKAPREVTITFLSGPRDGETATLAAGGARPEADLGRGAGCALVLADDPDVSRRHARLLWRQDAWLLEDLGSSNGTFVGEFAASRRIDVPTRLDPGAVFRVGNTRLRVEPAASPREAARMRKEAER